MAIPALFINIEISKSFNSSYILLKNSSSSIHFRKSNVITLVLILYSDSRYYAVSLFSFSKLEITTMLKPAEANSLANALPIP